MVVKSSGIVLMSSRNLDTYVPVTWSTRRLPPAQSSMLEHNHTNTPTVSCPPIPRFEFSNGLLKTLPCPKSNP